MFITKVASLAVKASNRLGLALKPRPLLRLSGLELNISTASRGLKEMITNDGLWERPAHASLPFLTPLEVERNELGYQLEEVRGKTLRVIRSDCPGSTCRIFFVHGGGGRAGQFKHQIKALKKDFQVIACDFLGHGDSPKPNRPELYTASELFEDLLAVYERHRNVQNILVAHCYGVIHMLRLLHHLAGRQRLGEIAGVVIIGFGSIAPGGRTGRLAAKLPAFVLEWLRPLVRESGIAARWSPTCDRERIEFEQGIIDNNRMYMMKVVAADGSDQARWDRWLTEGREALSTSSIPRLMICGEIDGIFSLQSSEEVRELLNVPRHCFHVVKGMAHCMQQERPEEVTETIRNFIIEEAKIIPASLVVSKL